jgi:hypothetical protein
MESMLLINGRIYRYLLSLYPKELRRRFGADMMEVFEDLLSDAYSERRAIGIASLWCNALWEFASVALPTRLSSPAIIAATLSFVVASAIAWVFFRAVGA